MRELRFFRQTTAPTRSASLLLLTSMLMTCDAAAVPTHPGKWTTTTMDWQSTAVNMVLLPGWSTNSHSRILWWHHNAHNSLAGGLWGWTPPSDGPVNSGQFPFSSFTELDMVNPPFHAEQPNNIFCAGQTMLPQTGRLLVTGGTALGEGGTRSTLIFNADSAEVGVWETADSMQFRRWYSANTLLPSGKVVTVTGSSFSHYTVVGGQTDGAGGNATALLQRYAVSYDDDWELPNAAPLTNTTPAIPLDPLA